MSKKMFRLYLVLSGLVSTGKGMFCAYYVIFLLSKGLSLLEVNLANMSYAVTLFLAEFPTGVIADTWGRKVSFVIACAAMGAGMVMYGFANTFWVCVLAEIVSAIGYTCATGAFQAWIVDTLRHHDADPRMAQQVFVREHQWDKMGAIVGVLVGSYIAPMNLSIPWWMGGALIWVAGVLGAIYMREDYFTRRTFYWKSGLREMVSVARGSLTYGLQSPGMRFLLLVTFVTALAVQGLNMGWQPFFGSSISIPMLGWIYVGIVLISLVGITFAQRWASTIQSKVNAVLLWNQIFMGLCALASAASPWLGIALVCFLTHEVGRGAYGVLMDQSTNADIPSEERASLLSFRETAGHAGMLLGLLMNGLISQYFSIAMAWYVSAIILIAGGTILMRMQPQDRQHGRT